MFRVEKDSDLVGGWAGGLVATTPDDRDAHCLIAFSPGGFELRARGEMCVCGELTASWASIVVGCLRRKLRLGRTSGLSELWTARLQ